MVRPAQSRAVLSAMKPSTARAFASRRVLPRAAPSPESLSLGSLGLMIRASTILMLTLLGLLLDGCTTPTEDRSWANLPVTHDPRPMYVLFSWPTADGSFRFALIRDRERGGGRNVFLATFDARRTTGFDFASLEQRLTLLPTSSLVDWFIEDDRRLSLPPPSVVQRIRRAIVGRKATLRLDNIKDWEA